MAAYEIVNHVAETEWREFVERQPRGNVFHTPELFHVFARTEGLEPRLWGARGGGGRVVALFLPVRITLSKWLSRFTTRAVAYGSVLCEESEEGLEGLKVLMAAYRQNADGGCLFTELRNLNDMADVQGVLQACGFSYEAHLNYLIRLDRSVEEIFQGIGWRTRKNIRRGLNRGEVTVREVADRGEVSTCYGLLRKTFRAARVPLCDASMFEAAMELLAPRKMVRFTLAEVDGAAAATSIELMYKDVVYGWYGGLDRSYRRYMPGEILMWGILRWCAENGYRVYDFGGAGTPDDEYGVRDFKAKFGGRLVSYGRNRCVHAPRRLWMSRKGYELVRRISRGQMWNGGKDDIVDETNDGQGNRME